MATNLDQRISPSGIWVDHEAHLLHMDAHTFPCDRDIMASATWKDCALLLSSDTDCLSLWDQDGLIRLTRIGVYPQDMAILEDRVCVCGGADCKLHLLSLPDLLSIAEYPLPGMPERIYVDQASAYILCLMTEPDVHSALLAVDLASGHWDDLLRLAGIPVSIGSDAVGLRVAVSEGTFHIPWQEIRTQKSARLMTSALF